MGCIGSHPNEEALALFELLDEEVTWSSAQRLPIIREILALKGTHPDVKRRAYVLLADCTFELGQYQECTRAARQVLKRLLPGQTHPRMDELCAMAYLRLGDCRQAIPHLTSAINGHGAQHRKSIPCLVRRGIARAAVGELEAGLSDVHAAVAINPKAAGVRLAAAQVLLDTFHSHAAAAEQCRAAQSCVDYAAHQQELEKLQADALVSVADTLRDLHQS